MKEAKTLFDEEPTNPGDTATKSKGPLPGSRELVLASETVALAAPVPGQSGMMALAEMEHGLQVLERAHKILLQIRRSAIGLTGPRDWVAMKGKGAGDTEAVCMLTNSGARRIAPFFQIQVSAASPVGPGGEFAPVEEHGEDGELQVFGWCEARSGLTGERVRITGRRSSSEDFVGRGVISRTSDLVAKGDLKEALSTLLYTKAVRELAGMKSVPVKELEELGLKLSQMTKGSGFTGADRSGAGASGSIKEKQDQLRKEIHDRTGGDKEASRGLLKDATIWKGKDGRERWAEDVGQVLQEFALDKALSRVASHPIFGDNAQGGNGGEA